MTPAHGVLIVDDDANQREPLMIVLEAHGYETRAAESAPAALAILRSGYRPCLIVLDLMMPGMDGQEFRRQQLSDPTLADIPVILYSAGGDLTPVANRLRVIGHACKPELGSLLQLIATHC